MFASFAQIPFIITKRIAVKCIGSVSYTNDCDTFAILSWPIESEVEWFILSAEDFMFLTESWFGPFELLFGSNGIDEHSKTWLAFDDSGCAALEQFIVCELVVPLVFGIHAL